MPKHHIKIQSVKRSIGDLTTSRSFRIFLATTCFFISANFGFASPFNSCIFLTYFVGPYPSAYEHKTSVILSILLSCIAVPFAAIRLTMGMVKPEAGGIYKY